MIKNENSDIREAFIGPRRRDIRTRSHNTRYVSLLVLSKEPIDSRTKTCSKCGKVKSTNQFYSDPRHSDGLYSRCKDCVKLEQNIRRNTLGGKAKLRVYCQSSNFRSNIKRYQRTPKGKHALYRAVRAHRKRYPRRARCRWAFNKAVQRGYIIRPAICSSCNKIKGIIQGHHPDYNKPFEVIWLCRECHRKCKESAWRISSTKSIALRE